MFSNYLIGLREGAETRQLLEPLPTARLDRCDHTRPLWRYRRLCLHV